MVEGGSVRLTARRKGAVVTITVENAFDPDDPPRHDLGVGLSNVRRRLQVRYGAEATIEAGPEAGVYRVVVRLPCRP